MVITHQKTSTDNCKYIGSGTGIGITLAWMMKHGNKRNMKCDQDDHFCAPSELNTNRSFHPIENHNKHMTVADDGHQHNF